MPERGTNASRSTLMDIIGASPKRAPITSSQPNNGNMARSRLAAAKRREKLDPA